MSRSFTVDRRRGMLLGVCRGFADTTGTSVLAVRAGVVLLTIAGLSLPGIIAYALIGLFAPRG